MATLDLCCAVCGAGMVFHCRRCDWLMCSECAVRYSPRYDKWIAPARNPA